MKLKITLLFVTILFITTSISKVNAQEFFASPSNSTALCNNMLYSAGNDLNSNGCLGFGSSVNQLSNFTQNPFNFPSPIKKVIQMYETTLVLLQNGEVYGYGQNGHGQLATGNITPQYSPTRLLGPNGGFLSNIIDIHLSVHALHAVAIDNQGRVLTWGINQITSGSIYIPTFVIDATTQLPLNDIIKVSSSLNSSVAIDSNGNVWVWGKDGGFGSLGLGTPNDTYPEAVQNPNINNAKDIISATASHLVLKHDGTLWSWGANTEGILGNGNYIDQYLPIQVIGGNSNNIGAFQDVIQIASNESAFFALKSDGTVWGWGNNDLDVINNSNLSSGASTNIPIQIQGENGVGYLQNTEKIYANFGTILVKQRTKGRKKCRFLIWGYKPDVFISGFQNNTYPEEIQLDYLNCCGSSPSDDSFLGFQTNKTTICPDTCVTLEAQIGTGNPTVGNWVVYGASSISNTSGLTTEVCFDTPGTYNVFAQINGNANITNTGIQITVLPENSRPCQIDSDNGDDSSQRSLSKEQVRVFPNPSKSIFNIALDTHRTISYSVKNIYGKQVFSNVLKEVDTFKIDLSNYTTGIYYLTIKSADETMVLQLVKE